MSTPEAALAEMVVAGLDALVDMAVRLGASRDAVLERLDAHYRAHRAETDAALARKVYGPPGASQAPRRLDPPTVPSRMDAVDDAERLIRARAKTDPPTG